MSSSFRASPRRHLTLAALAWLAAAVLAGCGVPQIMRGEVKPPHVALQGFTLTLPHAGAWQVFCTLKLKNPNPEALRVLDYDYELWLEGRSVAQGASQEEVLLPALGETVVEVPILIKLSSLMKVVPSLLSPQKQIPYQIAGGLRLASLLGGFRVPFRFQGEVTPEQGLDLLKSRRR
jgi:LEA14-like dessication related protein